MSSADDYVFMARAVRLAERGLLTTDPNPRVGCVLVKDGQVVGEGWHERAGGPHAEVHALAQAGEAARGATAYVTLEPCCHHGRTPPCSDALIAAGVVRVVVAMADPHDKVAGQGLEQLRQAGIAVATGVMENEARALNPGFAKRMEQGLPWLRCKLAMSLDGRTAMASGESQWITGAAARRQVQGLRARSSVIMTGIGTALVDDPSLTVRRDELGFDPGRQPLRVVVDSDLRLPPAAKLLSAGGPVLVACAKARPEAEEALRQAGAEVVVLPHGDGGVDLASLLRHLVAEYEANEVHVEAGATLSGALLRAELIDEIVIYMAAIVMGDAARGLFHLPGLGRLAHRHRLAIEQVRKVGEDWRIDARPLYH